MDMLFCSVLLAFVSLVVGPNTSPSEENVRNMLSTLRKEVDNEDVESREAVIRLIGGDRKTWFNLVAKCHFILRDKSASAVRMHACIFVKEHDCLLGQEMAKVCRGVKNEDLLDIWLGGLKQRYIAKSPNIYLDERSQEVSICLPRQNQEQKQSQNRSAKAEQQMTFHRTSFYVIEDSDVNLPNLEPISAIALKYDQKVVHSLIKLNGEKLPQILPDILHVCQKVLMEHRCAAEKNRLTREVSEAVEEYCDGDVGKNMLKSAQKMTVKNRAAMFDRTSKNFNFDGLISDARTSFSKMMAKDDLSDEDRACHKKKFEEVLVDIPKFVRNSMARRLLAATEKGSSGTVTWSPAETAPGLQYVCTIVKAVFQGLDIIA